MVETERLYSSYPTMKETEVRVLELREEKGKIVVLLDKTILYPEGGGPAGDRGKIGDCVITDTQVNREGEILHYLEKGSALEVDKVYPLRLDWTHRYHYMVEHTGQHLISGLLNSLFSIGTLSVHMGEHGISIETDAPEISDEKIETLLEEVERAILADVPVRDRIISRDQIDSLGLRRSVKVESDPRIVTIDGYDEIACGGIHVQSTGELKQVLFLGSESIRGHIRISFVFADEAKREIQENQAIVSQLKVFLSSQKEEVVSNVASLQSSLADERKRGNQLEELIISRMMEESASDSLPFVLDFSSFDFDAVSHASRFVEKVESIRFCAIQNKGENKSAYLIGIKGCENAQDLYQNIKTEVLDPFGAKGGGKAPLWRGVLNGSDVQEFLIKVQEVLKREDE